MINCLKILESNFSLWHEPVETAGGAIALLFVLLWPFYMMFLECFEVELMTYVAIVVNFL